MFEFIRKRLSKIFMSYGGKNVNNVTVNYLFSPIYFFIVLQVLKTHFKYPTLVGGSFYGGAFYYSGCSTLFYLYFSTFFQPDLDVPIYRPGYHSFPFGSSIKVVQVGKLKIGSLLRDLVRPITWIWYWMWHPYAMLLTHRGAGHWPIIGVWLRIAWLYLWVMFFEGVLLLFHVRSREITLVYSWMRAFFPGQKGFMTVGFFLFCFPVFIADIFHSAVDLIEAIGKGVSFCPPLLRRGILIRIGRTLFFIPKAIWDHLKDLS